MNVTNPINQFPLTASVEIHSISMCRIYDTTPRNSLNGTIENLLKRIAPYLETHEVELLVGLFYKVRVPRNNYFEDLLYILQYIEMCDDEKRQICQNLVRASLYAMFYSSECIAVAPSSLHHNDSKIMVDYIEIMEAWLGFFYSVLCGRIGPFRDEWLKDELTVSHAISFRHILLDYSITEKGSDLPDEELSRRVKEVIRTKNTYHLTLRDLINDMDIGEHPSKYITYLRILYVSGLEHRFGEELFIRPRPKRNDFEAIGSPKENSSRLKTSFSKRQRCRA